MKRYGAVLVFEPRLTKEQIEAALKKLELELKSNAAPAVSVRLEKFDDQYGYPVFYIP